MSKRYEVLSGRDYESNGEKKTQWTRCGVAFERDKGGFSLELDHIPAARSDKGTIKFLVVEPRPRDGGARGGGSYGGGSRSSGGSFPESDYGAGAGDDAIQF